MDTLDVDGDGVACPVDHLWLVGTPCSGANQDCNDLDSSIHPGAVERCGDGIDQDCDGRADESCPSVNDDSDRDGYTAASRGGTDCDDSNPAVYPGAADRCGDGLDQNCDGSDSVCAADEDGDRFLDPADCAPRDRDIYPGAQEVCNGRDDDCDGTVDEGNPLIATAGGLEEPAKCGIECPFGVPCACRQGPNVCTTFSGGRAGPMSGSASIQCFGRDSSQVGIEECNGIDDDCDGVIDGNLDAACYPGDRADLTHGNAICVEGTDRCPAAPVNERRDCVANADCVAGQTCVFSTCAVPQPVVCQQYQLPENEVCDGLDNDCNGQTDEGIPERPCGSSVGICELGTERCRDGRLECDGAVGGSNESCDGQDNDCDGRIDEDWRDLGDACSRGQGECRRQGVIVCRNNGRGSRCNAPEVNGMNETCDGLDNDCDGRTDEQLQRECDPAPGGGRQCSPGLQRCANGRWGACMGGTVAMDEICDGQDNDCDGQNDEDLSRPCGNDVGACEAGEQTCARGEWGDCRDAVGQSQERCDGVDNDCDGITDEGIVQACGDDAGACVQGSQTCIDGEFGDCVGGVGPVDEICDGLDNDCDGDTDEDLDNCGWVWLPRPRSALCRFNCS